MYCRRCKYDLHGSTGPACPECGRAFDPGDPRTWEPVRSKPKTSLAILAGALVLLVLVQLVLGVLRPLLPAAVVRLDWLCAVLAPVGAFASGWYANRRVARLLYGGLVSVFVVLAFHANTTGVAWIASAPVATQSTVWVTSALAMMLGCWLAGGIAWSLHIRTERAARATPRRRARVWPRPRTVVIVLSLAAAITLGWSANEVRKAMGSVPTLSVDYQGQVHTLLVEAADVRATEATEAWTVLGEAVSETRQLYREIARRRGPGAQFHDALRGDTVPVDAKWYLDAIETYRAAGLFDVLARQLEAPVAISPNPSWKGFWSASILVAARAASMRFAADDGRFDEAAEGFEEILATGRTFSYQGSPGAYTAGARHQAIGLDELRHELAEYAFPERTCRRLLDAIECLPLADVEVMLECERLNLHAQIQQRFTDDGRGNGYRVAAGAAALSIAGVRDAFARRFMLPDRREELDAASEAIDAAVADVALPLERSPAAARELPEEIADRYTVGAIAIAAAASLLEDAARHRQTVETTRLALAIAIFRARHERWPDRLDELVPRVLNELPTDPVTGAPFGYRRLEGDRHGRPYEIYSVGVDGVDNGGNYDFRPRHERRRDADGFDELLTPPRDPRRE